VSARFDAVDKMRKDWVDGKVKAAALNVSKLGTAEWVRFLEGMPAMLGASQLDDLEATFHFNDTANAEIAQRWYPLTVRSNWLSARPAIARFLSSIGRRKLIMPTYGALAATPDGLAFAKSVFEKARPGYHPITIASVEQTLSAGKAQR
jgi:hypothetical protein